jgi:hypothetical protein
MLLLLRRYQNRARYTTKNYIINEIISSKIDTLSTERVRVAQKLPLILTFSPEGRRNYR